MNITSEELDYIFQIAKSSVQTETKQINVITSPSEKSSDFRLLNYARDALNIICMRNKCKTCPMYIGGQVLCLRNVAVREVQRIVYDERKSEYVNE